MTRPPVWRVPAARDASSSGSPNQRTAVTSPKMEQDIARVVAALMPYQPERIILFGSAARGEADEYSDLDLVIIKQTDERFIQRSIQATRLMPSDVATDILVYTPEEFRRMVEEDNPFIEQVLKDAVVLYENTPGNG